MITYIPISSPRCEDSVLVSKVLGGEHSCISTWPTGVAAGPGGSGGNSSLSTHNCGNRAWFTANNLVVLVKALTAMLVYKKSTLHALIITGILIILRKKVLLLSFREQYLKKIIIPSLELTLTFQ